MCWTLETRPKRWICLPADTSWCNNNWKSLEELRSESHSNKCVECRCELQVLSRGRGRASSAQNQEIKYQTCERTSPSIMGDASLPIDQRRHNNNSRQPSPPPSSSSAPSSSSPIPTLIAIHRTIASPPSRVLRDASRSSSGPAE